MNANLLILLEREIVGTNAFVKNQNGDELHIYIQNAYLAREADVHCDLELAI